jgi:hypothetical protein
LLSPSLCDIHLLTLNLDSNLVASDISLYNRGLTQIVSLLRLLSPLKSEWVSPHSPPIDYNMIPPNQYILRKLNDHQFHFLLFKITMVIKNSIYLFLPHQISNGVVFTLEVRNFKFNRVQVPIHIFIIPLAIEIHIPPSPIRFSPNSLANRCKIIVIFTRICVFVNKLFKIRSDNPYGPSDRISSVISPTILLLYRIHLIF